MKFPSLVTFLLGATSVCVNAEETKVAAIRSLQDYIVTPPIPAITSKTSTAAVASSKDVESVPSLRGGWRTVAKTEIVPVVTKMETNDVAGRFAGPPTKDALSPAMEGEASAAAYELFIADLLDRHFEEEVAQARSTGMSGNAKDEQVAEYASRRLQSLTDFTPLGCNSDLPPGQCPSEGAPNFLGLKSLVDAAVAASSSEIEIPCGACVTVDYGAGELVDWDGGLNVVGKLYFPPAAHLTLRATHVFVQGIFKVDPPAAGKEVRIRLFGTEEKAIFPHEENAAACDAVDGCGVGKKPFAVAGGLLDIDGLADSTCPSWVKLQELAESPYVPTISHCSDLIPGGNGDAESSDDAFGPTIQDGAIPEIKIDSADSNNRYFSVNGRAKPWEGIRIDMPDAPACLAENQGRYYDLHFRYRLWSVTEEVAQVRIDYQNPDGSWLVGNIYTPNNPVLECPIPASSSSGWVDCSFTWHPFDAVTDPVALRIHLSTKSGAADVDFDDISVSPRTGADLIYVTPEAAACWNIGDEVLLTSPDMHQEKRDLGTIASIDASSGLITLAKPLIKFPLESSVAYSPEFAVEVASLTRAVTFEAENDDSTNDGTHGGHLIILRTPGVAQTIRGAAFVGFGQQGNLGRYPIHFHMSGSVAGSLVSKNVIRSSNQRGVVIHGSHDVDIIDNVAFDVKGHCYILEDGVETGNRFVRNLGAGVYNPVYSIPGENDASVLGSSVFWITNTLNEWIDNVAAGSQGGGYWFDTKFFVRGPSFDPNLSPQIHPVHLPITAFRDNRVHSSNTFGFQYYSPGWKPHTEQRLENCSAYRTRWGGHIVHGNHNLAIVGGLVADNGRGIDHFRSADSRFENVQIIGFSDNYAKVLETTKTWWPCTYGGMIYGMTLHNWRLEVAAGSTGVTADGLDFVNFGRDQGVCNMRGIIFNINQVQKNVYDAVDSLSNFSFDSDVQRIDACDVIDMGVENIAVEDNDGTLGPNGIPGFFVSDDAAIVASALSDGAFECTTIPEGCMSFCESACLNVLSVATSNANSTRNIKMVVTNLDGSGSAAGEVAWHHFVLESSKDEDHTRDSHDGFYGTIIPVGGNYEISFVDTATGEPAWPGYVKGKLEAPPRCASSAGETAVSFQKPPVGNVTSGRCSELAKHGDMDEGPSYFPWQGPYLTVLRFNEESSGGLSLRVPGTRVSQYIDVSCLRADQYYEFTADVRMEGSDGQSLSCTVGSDPLSAYGCPFAFLGLEHWNWEAQTESSNTKALANVVDEVDGWFKMKGFVILTPEEVASTAVKIIISHDKSTFFVDNVSMVESSGPPPTLAPTDPEEPCADIFPAGNSDAESSTMLPEPFEMTHSSGRVPQILIDDLDGNQFFALRDRRYYWDGMQTYLEAECMQTVNPYLVSFRYRYYGTVEAAAHVRIGQCLGGGCDIPCPVPASDTSGWVDCNLELFLDKGTEQEVKFSVWTHGDANLGDLDFDDFALREIVPPSIPDPTPTLAPTDPEEPCADIFPAGNSDAESSTMLPEPFEMTHSSGRVPQILIDDLDGNQFFALRDRRYYWDGMQTYLEAECMQTVNPYLVSFRYRYYGTVEAAAHVRIGQCLGGGCDIPCPVPASDTSGWVDCNLELFLDKGTEQEVKFSVWTHGDANLGDLDFDDFALREIVPPSIPDPTPTLAPTDPEEPCADIFPAGNSDAESSSMLPEPFEMTHSSGRVPQILIDDLDGNQFFALRDRRYYWDGMQTYLEAECMQTVNPYLVSFRYRYYGTVEAAAHVRIGQCLGGGCDIPCPVPASDTSGWVDCNLELFLDKGTEQEVKFSVWTHGDANLGDLDFDDFALREIVPPSIPDPTPTLAPTDPEEPCADIFPAGNSDAESSSMLPEPFEMTHSSGRVPQILIDDLDGNQFFALRDRRYYWDGMQTYLEAECMQTVNPYLVSFRYRYYGTVEAAAHVRIGQCLGGGCDIPCPVPASDTSGWVDCNLELFLDKGTEQEVKFSVWTHGNANLGDLDFDDFALREIVPPPGSNSCDDLIPVNGNAQVYSTLTFPFVKIVGDQPAPIVATDPDEEGGNRFFALRNRSRHWHGVEFNIDPGCLQVSQTYRVSFRYRLHQATPAPVVIKIGCPSGTCTHYCPPASASSGWVYCIEDLVLDGLATKMKFMTLNNENIGDLDFDDFSVIPVGSTN